MSGNRPSELGDELPHGFAHPERGIRPERRVEVRVVAPRGEQQPRHALLEKLPTLDPAALEAPGEARDRGQEGLDQPAASGSVAALGRDHQISLLARGQSVLSQ